MQAIILHIEKWEIEIDIRKQTAVVFGSMPRLIFVLVRHTCSSIFVAAGAAVVPVFVLK
jgi:hypothetical protein